MEEKKSVIVCLFWNSIAGLKWKRWQGKTTGVSWKPQLLWFLETQLSCTERKPITCPIVWGPRGEQASPWTINTNSLTIIPKLQCYTLKLELEQLFIMLIFPLMQIQGCKWIHGLHRAINHWFPTRDQSSIRQPDQLKTGLLSKQGRQNSAFVPLCLDVLNASSRHFYSPSWSSNSVISCHSSFVEFKFRLCIKNLIQFLHCVIMHFSGRAKSTIHHSSVQKFQFTSHYIMFIM